MMIVVEGPDLAGKTTFVDLLSNQLAKWQIDHARVKKGPPAPGADPYQEYEHELDRLARIGCDVVVADRWHWGETVYGPLFREHDRLDKAGWRHVELTLLAHGTLVVLLQQTQIVLHDRLKRRGDLLVRHEDFPTVLDGYARCLRRTALPTLCLRDPGEREANLVLDVAYQTYQRQADPLAFQSYLGSRQPRALLVGEKRGGDPEYKDRLAFTPRSSGAGRWLLEALPEELWTHVGLANALEDPIDDLWEWLHRPSLVALGHEAARELKRLRLPYAAVPHPQYVRRFHHGSLADYGQLIAHVVGTEQQRLTWKGTP